MQTGSTLEVQMVMPFRPVERAEGPGAAGHGGGEKHEDQGARGAEARRRHGHHRVCACLVASVAWP